MKRLGSLLIPSLLAACVALSPQPDPNSRPGSEQAANTPRTDGHAAKSAPATPAPAIPAPAKSAPATSAPATSAPADPDRIGKVGPGGTPPADLLPAAASPAAIPPIADRGIGGTGAPGSTSAALQIADRGIGGTGIVGVVTGFGSIFVNGIEVEYDATAAVDSDGSPSSVSALRAGQLVAIQADGPANAPHAKAIAIRSMAAGRIEALELGSGTLTIAGQAVTVPDGTWGGNHFGLGDWVKVSGLRREDGTIVASRLDPAPAGTLQARGQVVRDGDQARVGSLVLTGQAAASVKDGQFVVVSGTYAAGQGHISNVAADPLWPSPAAYFGPATDHIVVQAFVRVAKGSVSMNGLKVRSADTVSGHAQAGIAVVSLQRQPDGSYTAVDLRYGDYQGHTGQPVRGGSGAAADGSPAAQKNGHAATMSQSPASSDIGPPAAAPVATAGITADPYSVSASASSAQEPAKAQSAASVASVTPAEPSQTVASPAVTPVPVATPPVATTPAATSTAPSATVTKPAVTSPAPALTSFDTSKSAVSAATAAAAATPSAASAASPPPATAAATPTSAAAATTPAATTGSPSTAPSVQSVGSPGQLISSNGGGTATTSSTAALISSNTGAPAAAWDKPRVAGALAQRTPRRSTTFLSSTSAPGIGLLTAAVTSDTTTVNAPAVPVAAVNPVKPTSTAAVAGRTVPTLGTITTKQSSASRTH